jgi:hypothetical protein
MTSRRAAAIRTAIAARDAAAADLDASRLGPCDYDFGPEDLEPPDELDTDLFALGFASGLAGEPHNGITSPRQWFEGYLAGEQRASQMESQDTRGYLGAMARIDRQVLRREHAGHPALDWPAWTDSCWEPTPVEALTDSRDFGELDEPSEAVRGRPVDPETDWAEAELMEARQSSGHPYGPDAERGA